MQALVDPLPLRPEIGGQNLTVHYIIEYQDECNNGTELVLPPLTVVITKGQTALHVLENAVHSANDTDYRFTATYFAQWGYHVHTINGTSDTFENPVPKIPCYWSFLTQGPNSTDRVLSQVGLFQYVIPADNYTVIVRYTNVVYSPDSGTPTTPLSSSPPPNTPLVLVLLLSMMFSVMFV